MDKFEAGYRWQMEYLRGPDGVEIAPGLSEPIDGLLWDGTITLKELRDMTPRAWVELGAVADCLALWAIEGRPVGMDGDLVLDPPDGRQDLTTARPGGRNTLRPNRPQKLVASLPVVVLQKNRHAQLAVDVR